MKKVSIKPSKFMSLVGFIVGIIFCGVGIFYVIPTFDMFGIIWFIMAVLITIYYAINLFTKKGISLYHIRIDDKDNKDDD